MNKSAQKLIAGKTESIKMVANLEGNCIYVYLPAVKGRAVLAVENCKDWFYIVICYIVLHNSYNTS